MDGIAASRARAIQVRGPWHRPALDTNLGISRAMPAATRALGLDDPRNRHSRRSTRNQGHQTIDSAFVLLTVLLVHQAE
jgi:hypothetical protein